MQANYKDRATSPELLQKVSQRHERLRSEYSDQRGPHQEIVHNMAPWLGRFEKKTRANKKVDAPTHIYDSTAFRALRAGGAFFMGGGSSPARPWFKLGPPDPSLSDIHAVREYYSESARRMRFVLARSNVYQGLHQCYESEFAVGTACVLFEKNFKRVIHMHVQTVGQFFPATDSFGEVNTLYREMEMTVSQIVTEFGLHNVTPEIETQYTDGHNLETVHTVVHAVEPREDRLLEKHDQLNMAFRSVYFLRGEKQRPKDGAILREGGYDEFPYFVPRWSVIDRNAWGFGPGHEALPHAKRLQKQQHSLAKAVAYGAEPPMQGPASLNGRDVKLRPGSFTPVPNGASQKIENLFTVTTKTDELSMEIEKTQQQIQRALYNDLFLLVMNSRRAKTATEVDELHEEKMLMLGPALERMHAELLRPLVERTFRYMSEAGLLPPLPPELEGQPLQVEFVSMLQQMQQASGVVTLERWLTMVAASGEAFPDALDLVDVDNVVRDYADMLGVAPDNLKDPDLVAELRQARNEANAAAQQAEVAAQTAGAQKDVAAATKDAPELSGAFSGYNI